MAPEIIEVTNQLVEIASLQPNKQKATMTIPSTQYRLHFSCDHTGKYLPSSKRRITWRFGFTDLTSLEGKSGRDCRGEEHEIELIWSVKSGKTRVFWNRINISHFFREEQMFEEVNLSWEARSGRRFQIVASEKPLGDQHQYDLLIDGRSYFSLPRPSQLRAVRPDDVASDISLGSLEEEESTANCTDVEPVIESREKGDALEDVDIRLAITGLTPSLEKTEDLDSLEDELTSEFFANCLESLRHRVTLMIPEMEDLLSRAIVNAFSEDRDSQSSFSSCSCSFESANLTPIQIETTAIWEAISWMELNIDNAPRPDVEDQKRMFLQKQVDTIFVHTRQGHLNEDAAVRTLCNVAKIVGVELILPLPKDTVLLHGVNKHVNEEDVLCSLRMFGEIVDLAVSKGRRFGICRFRYEDSADKVLAASATGSLARNGIAPSITPVEHQDTIRRQPSLDDRAQLEPSPTLLMPSLKRARSHQRNTITIDTAMSAAPFLTAENAPPVVSPEKAQTILQPDVLINIPAMTTPQGYTPAVSP